MQFFANGIELPIKVIFDKANEQFEEMVKEKAQALVTEKLDDLQFKIGEFRDNVEVVLKDIINKAREELGLPKNDDYDY